MPVDVAAAVQAVPELQYFGPTAIVFGVVSVLFYLLVIRPLFPSNKQQQQQQRAAAGPAFVALDHVNANNNNINNQQQQQQQQQQQSPPQKCTRVPPHLNTQIVTAINNGANVLLDGLVAFKYTRAAAATTVASVATATATDSGAATTTSINTETDDRKARARLLANLLNDPHSATSTTTTTSNTTTTTTPPPPPAKGGCIAVTLSLDDANSSCELQRRALVLLASYYNLLVLVAVPPKPSNTNAFSKADAVVAQLRGATLTPELLPRHRIVFTSTITGRVAFVRQLQRIELVLDYDPEVKALLSRFGHRVIVYGQPPPKQQQQPTGADDTLISKLGRALL